MMIKQYLASAYRDGGRGEVVNGRREFDCWGLTRSVRDELYGMPVLPSYGAISPDDKVRLTRACQHEALAFKPGRPEPSAIATAWKNALCVHVAVCVELDGRLGVLETNRQTGPRWTPIDAFERQYLKVVYYS